MILLSVKLVLFLLGTISFGYVASFLFLKERRISLLVPFAILIGLSGYMFFVNAVSYVIPIQEAVWLVLGVFCLFVAYQIYRKGIGGVGPEIDFTRRELGILFGLAMAVATVSGVVQLRLFDHDDYVHLQYASTISEGNFPVMSPTNPDSRLAYHYGPDLLSAAMHNVTGVPWLQDYDIQTFFFTGITFLLSFALAFYISGSFYTSLVASLFFFYAGGLLFLNISHGFSPLYHKFILHENVVGTWKFIADMLLPKINHFYTYGIRNHTTVMGTPLMLAIVYLYFKYIDGNKARVKEGILIGLLLGGLALSLETSFVIVSFVFMLAFFWRLYALIISKDTAVRQNYVSGMKLIATIVITGSILALLQGGVLTKFVSDKTIVGNQQSFAVNWNPLMIPTGGNQDEYIPVFSSTFFKDFGLPILLFPLSVFVFRRNKKILFLSSIGVTAFLMPLLIIWVLLPGEMKRIFSVSTPIFAFVSAFLICFLVDKYKENIKIKSALLIVSLLVISGGLTYQLAGLITPLSDFGKIAVPFVAGPAQPTSLDSKMYEWIHAHTVPASRFFPYDENLIFETGRMSPGNYLDFVPEYKMYTDVVDTCDIQSVTSLGLNYIIVSPPGFSSGDFLRKCAQLDAELVFSAKDGSDYREIYKIHYR